MFFFFFAFFIKLDDSFVMDFPFFASFAIFTPFFAIFTPAAASPTKGTAARRDNPASVQLPLKAEMLAFIKSGIAPKPGTNPAASKANWIPSKTESLSSP